MFVSPSMSLALAVYLQFSKGIRADSTQWRESFDWYNIPLSFTRSFGNIQIFSVNSVEKRMPV